MTNRYRNDKESPSTRWITLGQACKLLGVNESTLRRWADAGHVRSFRTPGGHRRFSEEDLQALVAGQAPATREPYTSISSLALARIRRRLQRGRSQPAGWYSRLAEEDREQVRPLGRRMVSLVSEYLMRGSRRSNIMEEAKEISHEYADLLKEDGVSLRDAVEGYTFFRKTLDESAMEEAQKTELTGEKALELWDLLSNLQDQILISIAESYDRSEVTPARS